MNSLNKLSLNEAASGLHEKLFSSSELVQSCLDQISKYDSKFHTYLHVNSNALGEAKEFDNSAPDNKSSQPLKGIPIAVKDNFLTIGLPTTAASNILKNFQSPYESTVTARLKAAGAIIIGKTNMDAWAHGSSTETSDYGPTYNPWNTGYLPGGSSGGSAAAVIADMCIAAIGSETAGSIRQPAAWCGTTGFKPTYGRTSRYGVVAMASSTDSPGPITKTALDSALLARIISGQDPYDATTSPLPVPNYLSLMNRPISKLKIGIPKEYLLPTMRSDVRQIFSDAAHQFSSLGAEITEVSTIDPAYSIGVYTIIQRSEVSSNLARYDGIRYGQSRDQFGEEAKRRIMLGTYALSSGYYDQYYNKAQKVRSLIIADFAKIFKTVDVLISPTSPGPAQKIGASKDQPMFGEMEDILLEPSSIAGLVGISVPCGFIDGLPIGLQIIGPQFSESLVLNTAHQYQLATTWHHERPQL